MSKLQAGHWVAITIAGADRNAYKGLRSQILSVRPNGDLVLVGADCSAIIVDPGCCVQYHPTEDERAIMRQFARVKTEQDTLLRRIALCEQASGMKVGATQVIPNPTSTPKPPKNNAEFEALLEAARAVNSYNPPSLGAMMALEAALKPFEGL